MYTHVFENEKWYSSYPLFHKELGLFPLNMDFNKSYKKKKS